MEKVKRNTETQEIYIIEKDRDNTTETSFKRKSCEKNVCNKIYRVEK